MPMDPELIKIGYWFSVDEPDLPIPRATVWNSFEKETVAAYLDEGEVYGEYRGWSTCRMCEASNGSKDLTDGVYIWPSGLSHYVREHDVQLPSAFVAHVLEQARSVAARNAVIETFRDFMQRHGYKVAHVKDGAFIDDSQIMALYGEMSGQFRKAVNLFKNLSGQE